jgi:hypothetical protein
VASWFDRLKLLRGPAGLDLMTSAALLLLVSGPQALAEDEPAARAPLPPLLPGRPYGSRRAADARPSVESQSVGPSRAGDQARSTKVPIGAKGASPPHRVVSRYLGGQEARNARAAREPFDGRGLSQARPPRYRLRQKTKTGPAAGRACDRPPFPPPARLSRSDDREHHRASSGAAASSTPLLSRLLCRSARIWLYSQLSLCMGTTRTWGLSVKTDPLQDADTATSECSGACFKVDGGQRTR